MRKYQENFKIDWRRVPVPTGPFENKTSIIAVKNCTKADIKVVWSCLIFLDFFTLFLRKGVLKIAANVHEKTHPEV